MVKVGEENALEMLVEIFDWLNGLEPQPTTETFPLFDKPRRFKSIIADDRDLMGQTAAREAKRLGVLCSRSAPGGTIYVPPRPHETGKKETRHAQQVQRIDGTRNHKRNTRKYRKKVLPSHTIPLEVISVLAKSLISGWRL